jgi:hypothetical protein
MFRVIRNSEVGTATRLQAGMTGDRIPLEGRDVSLLSKVHDVSGDPLSRMLNGYLASSLEANCDVNHSPPSSAEVKNE